VKSVITCSKEAFICNRLLLSLCISLLCSACARQPSHVTEVPSDLQPAAESPYLARINQLRAQTGYVAPASTTIEQAQGQESVTDPVSGDPEPGSRLLWHFTDQQQQPSAAQSQVFSLWQRQQQHALSVQVGPVSGKTPLESARLALLRAQALQRWLDEQSVQAHVRYVPQMPLNQVLWLAERQP
jgi:hypothetical protein